MDFEYDINDDPSDHNQYECTDNYCDICYDDFDGPDIDNYDPIYDHKYYDGTGA